MRDLTKAQFRKACSRYGFRPEGFMGYYRLPVDGKEVFVSVLNAGLSRREWLAYLIRETKRVEAEDVQRIGEAR